MERVLERLRTFGSEVAESSPLYAHLALHCAEDPEVAGLLAAAPDDQDAQPTLLFAAVHRALAGDPINQLADYYPTLGGTNGVDAATWPLFRRFVLDHADRIRTLIATHVTQTNEVGRAALLYPAVALAARRAGGAVGLLEVGCSAGLLLGMDRYAYRYQTEQAGQIVCGPVKSPLGVHCALELAAGATQPALPKKLTVRARVGLDRRPIDVSDDEQAAWLEACIWADQPERVRLLTTAMAMQRRDRPELVAGDMVDDLAAAAARIPAELPLVVYTSVVLQYLPAERRPRFVEALGELAASRPVWWVTLEHYRDALAGLLPRRTELGAGDGAVLAVVSWRDGEPVTTPLARTAWWGRRMRWLA